MGTNDTFTRMKAHESNRVFPREKNKNIYRGKRSLNMGNEMEAMIKIAYGKYADEMFADISKSEEPMRISEKISERKYICLKTQQDEPGYKGMLYNGHAVAFEVRHTISDRVERRMILPHQENYMDRCYKMNAIAFILVSLNMERFFRIPWWVWKDMKALYGRKYLKADDIKEFEMSISFIGAKPALLFLEDYEDIPLYENSKPLSS